MKGHEKIIECRISGKTPKDIFMNDYPCETDWFKWGEHATVCTFGDVIQTLDLRFVKGLTVHITSLDEARAKELFARCKAAGAKVIAACHQIPHKKMSDQNGWFEIYRQEESHA